MRRDESRRGRHTCPRLNRPICPHFSALGKSWCWQCVECGYTKLRMGQIAMVSTLYHRATIAASEARPLLTPRFNRRSRVYSVFKTLLTILDFGPLPVS